MTTELIKVSSSVNELKITVPKEEYASAYNKHLNSLKKQLKMPGFRAGKVPTHLIQQLHGESVKLETQENIANEQYQDFIKNNNLYILSSPQITDIKTIDDGSQEYTIRFDVMPDFEPKDYKSLEIYEPYHKVADAEIEKEISHIALHFGQKVEADTIVDYNVIVNIEERLFDKNSGQDVTTLEQMKAHNIQLNNEQDEVKELFLNHKIGDTITYSPKVENNQFETKITIKAITQITPHDINDELAKLASNNKFDNMEDLRQDIGFAMQKQWDDKTNELIREQIISKVTELHDDVELPQSLIDTAKNSLIGSLKEKQSGKFNENDPNMQEYLNKMSEKIARIEMVRENIINKEKIEVEDYDYENTVDEFINSYAQPGQPPMFERDTMLQHLKNDPGVKSNLLNKKYIDFLLDFAKTIEIDYDEYIEKNMHEDKFL